MINGVLDLCIFLFVAIIALFLLVVFLFLFGIATLFVIGIIAVLTDENNWANKIMKALNIDVNDFL